MARDGQEKVKFDRRYIGFNPNGYTGPTTLNLDTIVKPTLDSYDGYYRDIKKPVQ